MSDRVKRDPARLAEDAISFWGIEHAAEACRAWAFTTTNKASRKEWNDAAAIIDKKREGSK